MRSLGLDVFRTISIFVVVLAHSLFFFREKAPIIFQFIVNLGQWGVNFFFVLSGYLIGCIMIKMLEGEQCTKKIDIFILRRWLKTLPEYYLVLVFFFIFVTFPSDFLAYVFFYKGFELHDTNILGVAWSLYIEELFYLICAALIYMLYKLNVKNIKRSLLIFCCLIISFSIGIRLYFYLNSAYEVYKYVEFYKTCLVRLDAPIFGLMIAVIQCYYTNIYNFLQKNKYKIFIVSVFFILFSLDLNPGMDTHDTVFISKWGYRVFNDNFFKYVLFFAFSAFASAGLLFAFISFPEVTSSRFKAFFLYISQSSYAVYLIHADILLTLSKTYTNTSITLRLLLAFFLIYSISYLMVRFVEWPILAWRDRRFPL